MGFRIQVGLGSEDERRGGGGGDGSPLLGFLICLALGSYSLWIAWKGENISGGIPLLPSGINEGIGRIIFALCGLFVLGLAGLALRQLLQSRPED